MTIKLSNLILVVIAITIFIGVVGLPVVDWFQHALSLAHASSEI